MELMPFVKYGLPPELVAVLFKLGKPVYQSPLAISLPASSSAGIAAVVTVKLLKVILVESAFAFMEK